MFDSPHPQGGGGGEPWFYISKLLTEDVPRGDLIGITFNNRFVSIVTREPLPKGLMVVFWFTSDTEATANYELIKGQRVTIQARVE